MARALEEDGFRVLQAENGLEAWRIFEELGKAIRLVITDIVMPGLGGRELAERIGATPATPAGALHYGVRPRWALAPRTGDAQTLSARRAQRGGQENPRTLRPPARRSTAPQSDLPR